MSIQTKVSEAQLILLSFGFDAQRYNERSALTLLALLGLKADMPWAISEAKLIGTHAIMAHMREHLGKDYAPNSRETIRRQTLHQFVEAGFVSYNPDDPNRAVNSSLNSYQITEEALKVIRAYGTDYFKPLLEVYLEQAPGLTAKYGAARDQARIPVKLPGGEKILLSPGGQNPLIAAMVSEFCARFVPGGEVIYIGDADSKMAVFDEPKLADLGVVVDHHGKLPDLVVYDVKNNWLFLMEAASTHGPVDAKRQSELATLFGHSTAGLVYVSCFPNRATMRKFLSELAWESEAWCADAPSHMIHLNGDRFLGPHS